MKATKIQAASKNAQALALRVRRMEGQLATATPAMQAQLIGRIAKARAARNIASAR